VAAVAELLGAADSSAAQTFLGAKEVTRHVELLEKSTSRARFNRAHTIRHSSSIDLAFSQRRSPAKLLASPVQSIQSFNLSDCTARAFGTRY
jgi:hypothetical protein